MITTDEEGQKMIQEIWKRSIVCNLTEWEDAFLSSTKHLPYSKMTQRQKSVVCDIYEKHIMGKIRITERTEGHV